MWRVMDSIRMLIGRLMARIRPREEPPRKSEHYDRHWGEWWPFVAQFSAGKRDDGEE